MLVGIYDLKDANGGSLEVLRRYEQILALNGIPSVRLTLDQPDFWDGIKRLSHFIMRFKQHDSHLQLARDLLPIIERAHGVPCFPNLNTGWHYDDKVKQYCLMRPLGIPMVESWVFQDKAAALRWVEDAPYPLVFKLRGGAGSQNVLLVQDARQAKRLVRRMFGRGVLPERFLAANAIRFKHFNAYRELHHLAGNLYRWSKGLDVSPFWQIQKNYILFQRFLPGNHWDTRVTVIGDRAFAFRRMVRKDDFRASGSGKIDYDTEQIDLRCVKIAFDVSKRLGFQSMAYDFLINPEGEPEFCEVSYTYVSRAIYDCPGYWTSDLNWHPGHYWPEHLHLIDLLGLPDLRAPEAGFE